jgi:hypothetical protein
MLRVILRISKFSNSHCFDWYIPSTPKRKTAQSSAHFHDVFSDESDTSPDKSDTSPDDSDFRRPEVKDVELNIPYRVHLSVNGN